MASAMSFSTPTTLFHQPAARRPISFCSQPRYLLYPLSKEEKRKNRSSLPSASRDLTALVRRRNRAASNEYIQPIVPNKKEINDPNEMARLITLVLQPRLHHKRDSTYLSLLETLTALPCSTPTPTPPPAIPAKVNRRSLVSVPTTVVYTREEWKQAMEEVKSLFAKRHFKKCAAICKHLLEEIHNQSQRQPIYTTYLCFYAAISLEQTARSLHINSDTKLPLFHDSLAHYQKAKANISSTSFIIPRKRTRASARSSTKSSTSSNRSSLESLFSQFSLSSSDTSVPDKYSSQHHKRNTSSVSSAIMKPAPLRIQKKVSFSDSLPTFITEQAQQSPDDNWDLINSFPMPPSPSNCPSLMDSSSESEDEEFEAKTRENAVAIQRFQLHLSKFAAQLDWHINAINGQVYAHEEVAKKQKEVACAAGELAKMKSALEDEARKAELKRRIKQRRGEKWERKKFDARRYQELCEKALAEVDGALAC